MNKISNTYKPEFENYEVILKTPYFVNINKIEYVPNITNIKSPIKSNSNILYTIIFNSGEESLVKSTYENGKYYFVFDTPLNLTTPYTVDSEVQNILYPKNTSKSNELLSVSDLNNNDNLLVNDRNNGILSSEIFNKLINLIEKKKIWEKYTPTFDTDKKSKLFILNLKRNESNKFLLKMNFQQYDDVYILYLEIDITDKYNIKVTNRELIQHEHSKYEPNFYYNYTFDIGFLEKNGKFAIELIKNNDDVLLEKVELYAENNLNQENIFTDISQFDNIFNTDDYIYFRYNKYLTISARDSHNNIYELIDGQYNYFNRKTLNFELLKNLKPNDTFDFNKTINNYGPNIVLYQRYLSGLNLLNKPDDFNTNNFNYFIFYRLFNEENLLVIDSSFKTKIYKRYYHYENKYSEWKLSSNIINASDIITSDELQFVTKSDKEKLHSLFDVDNTTEEKPKISISNLKIKDGDVNSVIKGDGSTIKISDLKSKVIKIPKGSLGNSTSTKYTIEFTDDIKNQFGTLFNLTVYEFVRQQ